MANNVIGYVGIDNFDIILYLSKILQKLGKKVLVIDHSETRSLEYTIPIPKGLDSSKDIITYRRVDFTAMELDLTRATEYDDILIAYGFHNPVDDIVYCNRIVYVTDLYLYNQERFLMPECYIGVQENVVRSLLIKNMVYSRITPGTVSDRLGKQFSPGSISCLYFDERDYEISLECHLSGVSRFAGISRQLRSYLKKETCTLYPETDMAVLKKVFRKAQKGD